MIHKPQTDEHAPYAAGYIGLVDTTDVIGLLEQLKDTTYKLFIDLSEEQAMYSYAEGKWTLKQMLGHIIDTERVFSFRAFVFSRENAELPGFDQDVYINNTDFSNSTVFTNSTIFSHSDGFIYLQRMCLYIEESYMNYI